MIDYIAFMVNLTTKVKLTQSFTGWSSGMDLYITSYILQHNLSKRPPCLVLWQEEHYKPIILCCIIYDAVYNILSASLLDSIHFSIIKRRLASRQFPVTYNPLTRHLDPLPCESCFHPKGAFYICDDRLHIVCAGCFRTCPDCSKQYCHACNSVLQEGT